MEHYDIAVVGAGLAGLQCARLLGTRGFRVLLADSKTSPDHKIHTTGIFVRRTLEDFDLPEECLGPPVRRVSLYSPTGRRMILESPRDEFRVGRMASLYSRFLDGCLRAGVTWRPGARFSQCVPAGQHSLIHFLTSGKEPFTVRARFVVGADGACSRVAGHLGLGRNSEWIVGIEEVFRNVPLDPLPEFHCFLDPGLAPGYLAWVVNDGEEAHVGVGGYANRFDPAASLARFEAGLSGIVDLSAAELIERRGGRIPVGGILSRIANQRGLLVGDAAGAVSPLTGGGLDPCMRLSTYAADVIQRYLQAGDSGVLREYSGARFRKHFRSRRWMRVLMSHISSRSLLEAAFRIAEAPPFRSIAWRVFFGDGSFPVAAPVRASQSPITGLDSP